MRNRLGNLVITHTHIAVELDVRPDDFWQNPLEERGGAVRAKAVFDGTDLSVPLTEINDVLAV